ncbi:MAG TPA: ureidoglycolate lyase [Xanthomonadales bacterium]
MTPVTSPHRGIRLEALTKEAFAPFGDVLETSAVEPRLINFGHTQKFGNLAQVAVGEGGIAQISIYRSSAIDLPFRIHRVECHPLGSQAFYPLHHRPFPVVVARAGNAPGPADLRVFLTNGRQGVNLHPGVWHHYQLSLGQDSDYLVIDRAGEGDNYREQHFEEEVWLVI